MRKVETVWYNAKEEMPTKSCEVVVITEYGAVMYTTYSAKYKAFNTRDICDTERAESTKLNNVAFWAYADFVDKLLKKS